ncbi:MAG: helix-turn-helix transcriptional regulator [Bacteroidales bacterium]|nr:helix-turn-helix transcriptional regulator [Bacteroidales bacterium]
MEDNSKLRVKQICKERGLTLKQLAEKMGVAPETLTRAISDNANPTLATLKSIANALEIDISEIFVSTKKEIEIHGIVEINGEVYTLKSIDDLNKVCDRFPKSEI